MSLIRKVFAKVRNPAQFGLTIVAFNYICSKIIKMETIRPNSFKAWLLASRPKTLTAAAIPVMIGCSLAATHGSFQPVPAILCFLFAFYTVFVYFAAKNLQYTYSRRSLYLQ